MLSRAPWPLPPARSRLRSRTRTTRIEVALKDLGDVTLDFQLVVWVRNDTLLEPYRVRSLYLSAIDDTITRCGFPQPNPAYDVNLKGAVPPAG